MYIIKKKTTIIAFVALLAILVSAITLTQVIDTASAATIESYDDLDFKLVNNTDGTQSYSVSLKSAYRPTAEFVVVPSTYNGLPVTEVAANGFMSCAKLSKVILSKNIVKIGKNAFMNCTSLKRISMSSVQTIGDNAFANCTALERLYFPLSVNSVGANILRNNPNTIYLQGSQDEIDKSWSSTWNSYFTGKTVYSVDPEEMIQYREVLGTDNQTVVGYEIQEYQFLAGTDEDIVIYNMIKSSEDAKYLPVLNICSEAFAGSMLNSLSIKDIHEADSSAPVSTHKINIRSTAFAISTINEINIQVSVTFNHSQGLVQEPEFSMLDEDDSTPITGDANDHSMRVFEESTIQSITLPADIDIITENMFKNCVYLESIKINGIDYDRTNVLPNVDFIGSYAFESCVGLSNLTISDSVSYFGHSVFNRWGINIEHQKLNLDFYEGFVPGEADWNAGIEDNGVVQIKYREPTTIYLDLQDGSAPIPIEVKPGLEMPELPEITRLGYIFKGVFSNKNASGYQYYTDSKEVARLWQEGEDTTLYVYWTPEIYKITYDCNVPGVSLPDNPTEYTIESNNIYFILPELDGYDFITDPEYIPTGSVGSIKVKFIGTPKEYDIYYELDGGENHKDNPKKFNVTQHIELLAPTKTGYIFMGWYLKGVNVTTLDGITDNVTLFAKWEPVGVETELDTSSKTTTIYAPKVNLNLTNAPYISGCTLIVKSSVAELLIYSNTPITYYMSIVVEDRNTNITIKLININLRGTGYCDTITVKSDIELHLYAINSSVYGQEGARGVDGMLGLGMNGYGGSGEVGGKGYAAIKCHTLVIHTSVTIYGGTGGVGGTGASAMYPGSGGRGGLGGLAVDAQEIVVSADGVKLVGGDGGRGGRGALDGTGTRASSGGTGGAGSEATNANISGTYAPELVTGQQGAQGEKGSWGPVHYGLDETYNI